MLLEAKKLANNAGIVAAEDDVCLIYLGKIEPIRSFKGLKVLAVVTGEY